jgi:two-component system, sensor histidine kinase
VTDETRLGNCSPTGGGTEGIEGLRVLYAEDHPAMRRAVGRLLRVSGASVVSAQDGLEATERALAETFDLVVMDVRMPRMDGFEAARALRAGGCRVPLVAVTVDVTPAVRANALAAGFDAVLAKPFGVADLIHALQLVREGRPAEAGVVSRAAKRDSSLP